MNAPGQRAEHETLDAMGWSAFFADQLTPDDADLEPARISRVHRSRLTALSTRGVVEPVLGPNIKTNQFAVGDLFF